MCVFQGGLWETAAVPLQVPPGALPSETLREGHHLPWCRGRRLSDGPVIFAETFPPGDRCRGSILPRPEGLPGRLPGGERVAGGCLGSLLSAQPGRTALGLSGAAQTP